MREPAFFVIMALYMPHQDKFIHLHTHTEYSLLDGACRIPDLVARAKELGMSALAVTDHGNMYAAVEFYLKAKEEGLKPIIGCEMYVAPRTRFDKETKEDRSPYHLTCLAKNSTGYHNLMKLASLASIEGFYSRPRVDRELLEKYKEGLVVMSGCAGGEVQRHLLAGRTEEARAAAEYFKSLWGDDFYLEIMDFDLEEFRALKPALVKLSKETGIPLVASNDVHCAACATLHSVAPGVTAGFVVQLTNAPLAPRQVAVAYTSHQPSSNLLVRPPPSA